MRPEVLREALAHNWPLQEDWARWDASRPEHDLAGHLSQMKEGKSLRLRHSGVKVEKYGRAAYRVKSSDGTVRAQLGAGPDTEMEAAHHAMELHRAAGSKGGAFARMGGSEGLAAKRGAMPYPPLQAGAEQPEPDLEESPQTAALSVTHAPIGKGGTNWITKTKPGNTGQLPAYIQNIRNAMMRSGKSESDATGTAIAAVKRWAAGAGNVSAEVKAAAAKAVGEWEALKGEAHAKSGAKDAVKKAS